MGAVLTHLQSLSLCANLNVVLIKLHFRGLWWYAVARVQCTLSQASDNEAMDLIQCCLMDSIFHTGKSYKYSSRPNTRPEISTTVARSAKAQTAPYTTPIHHKWNSLDRCNLKFCRYLHCCTKCNSKSHRAINCPTDQQRQTGPFVWMLQSAEPSHPLTMHSSPNT